MSYTKASELIELALEITARHRGMTYAEIDERSEGPTPEARRRNTQRRVRALERLFGDRLVTGSDERGKVVRLASGPLRSLIDLEPAELTALDHGIEVLATSNAAMDADHLAALRTKLRLLQSPRGRSRIEVDHEALLQSSHVLVRPGPRPRLDPARMAPLAEALLALRRIEFDYASETGQARKRTVDPYGIIAGHRAYLLAEADSAGGAGPVLWRIDRMRDIVVLDQPTARPDGFDLAAFARRAFGAYHKEAEFADVEWRFAPAVAERALSYGFHPDQVVTTNKDGSVTVRFAASGLLEMAWALYPWGDSVEVVKPEALRQLVLGHQRSDFAGP